MVGPHRVSLRPLGRTLYLVPSITFKSLAVRKNFLRTDAPGTSVAQMYVLRSQRNVDSSDGTIAFRLKESTGTDKTIGYCASKKWSVLPSGKQVPLAPYRPCLVISDISRSQREKNIEAIQYFIRSHKIKILNIAGHRDDQTSGVPNFQHVVKQLLVDALKCDSFSK